MKPERSPCEGRCWRSALCWGRLCCSASVAAAHWAYACAAAVLPAPGPASPAHRSEEGRGGEEGRYRWGPSHLKKKEERQKHGRTTTGSRSALCATEERSPRT